MNKKSVLYSVNRFGCVEPGLLLWLVLLYPLSHIIYLMPVMRQMLGRWSELFSSYYFLVGVVATIIILYTWFNRIPEAGKGFRIIWQAGRFLLCFVYSWFLICLVLFNISVVSRFDHGNFWSFVVLFFLYLAAIFYTFFSGRAKAFFCDFPSANAHEIKRFADENYMITRREFINNAKFDLPICQPNTPSAFEEKQIRLQADSDPLNYQPWFALGVLAFQNIKINQANIFFKKSLELSPNNFIVLRSLCEVNRQMGRISDAVIHGNNAVAAAPIDEISHMNLALALIDNKSFELAIRHLHKVISINPLNSQAWFNLAKLLFIEKRFQDASSAIDAYLLIVPNDIAALDLKEAILKKF